MAKPKLVSNAKRLCADSRDLIDQLVTLISGSGAACTVFTDQIEKDQRGIGTCLQVDCRASQAAP